MRERLKGNDGSPHPYMGGGVQADRYGQWDKIRHFYRMWAISLNYVKIVPQICAALIKDNYTVSSLATTKQLILNVSEISNFQKKWTGLF